MDERSTRAITVWLMILAMSLMTTELNATELSTTDSACQAAAVAAVKSRNRGGRLRAEKQLSIIETANNKCQRILAKLTKAKRRAPKDIKSPRNCAATLSMTRKMAHRRAAVVIQAQLNKIQGAQNRCLKIIERLTTRR
jgi:hypothetical protein